MLNIIHYPDVIEYNKTYYENKRLFSKAHLVSYKDDDKVVIVKSRWFTGEYPHEKLGTTYIVDFNIYCKIVQDTICIYCGKFDQLKSATSS